MTNLGSFTVNRIGFGAMQLAGPGVFGPPRDPDAARAVLRRAVELGVDHIDTAQYYGPDVVNALIRDALRPYPTGCGSRPRWVRDATTPAPGCPRSGPRSCAPAWRTTCASWAWSAWTS